MEVYMTKQRIVDLSLPIIDGGGFGRPARLSYYDHKQRGKIMAATLGIDPQDIDHRANAMEEFSFLTTHTGTHFDAPYHYTDTTKGEPALTVDLVPLEWCFGSGIWLDLSHKAPGTDITADDIKVAVDAIQYKIRPKDIVLVKTGAGASYGQDSCDNMNAGMTREATLWLADNGVRLVGIDACCWDRPPELQLNSIKKGERQGRYMEGHRAAGNRGICILEWLTNLDQLPHYGFTVYAFPIKIERAGGSWVRVVAIVEAI
jgi:kynurenine formamidase